MLGGKPPRMLGVGGGKGALNLKATKEKIPKHL